MPIVAVTALALVVGTADTGQVPPYEPSCQRIRSALARARNTAPRLADAIASAPVVVDPGIDAPRAFAQAPSATVKTNGRDSIWNGLLIGAGIGAGAGYLWARGICGSNDSECSAITTPVGLLAGAGIGAAAGGILDFFSH